MRVHLWKQVQKIHTYRHIYLNTEAFFTFFHQNFFARNFYNMRLLALFVAFAINFILLFYKVRVLMRRS